MSLRSMDSTSKNLRTTFQSTQKIPLLMCINIMQMLCLVQEADILQIILSRCKIKFMREKDTKREEPERGSINKTKNRIQLSEFQMNQIFLFQSIHRCLMIWTILMIRVKRSNAQYKRLCRSVTAEQHSFRSTIWSSIPITKSGLFRCMEDNSRSTT